MDQIDEKINADIREEKEIEEVFPGNKFVEEQKKSREENKNIILDADKLKDGRNIYKQAD